ncbi:MAG: phosphate ABC transporter substrate-binding protein [Bacilli bacterium]|nr:phosphate ABC transporter substrate-binding protein [Bacilli bacterium]
MKKILSLVLILLVCTSCKESSNQLEVSGSTSIAPVMEKLIASYEKDNNVKINLTADGSSAGITAATDGVSDIGMSSRSLTKDELKDDLNVNIIGIDAIVVVVNKNNGVDNLTIDDLHDIYSGKKTNWKDFGGINRPIVLVSRENGSGTRDAFEENIKVKTDQGISLVDSNNPVIVNSTGAVIENVAQKEGAIGYMSLGSVDDEIKAIKLNGVEPSEQSIIDKKYPITRDFYLVSKKDNKKVDEFISFILSKKGQQIMENEGFIKVK